MSALLARHRQLLRPRHARRRTVSTPTGPRSLTFGREPVYLRCTALSPEIAGDPHLVATPVEAVDPGVPIIDLDLKSERVQGPEAAAAPGEPPTTDLKSERVQEPEAAAAPGEPPTTDLKSERVQEPEAAASARRPSTKRKH